MSGGAGDSSKPKAKKASPTQATHPTYQVMVTAAITQLKERNGSSRQKIVKYVKDNYKVSDNFNVPLKTCIRRLIKSGQLVQVKGTGASGSFKLAKTDKKPVKKEAKKKPVAAKKPAAKKAVAAKKPASASAKKTTAKKAAAAKKPAAKKSPKKPAAKKAPAKKSTTAKKPSPKKAVKAKKPAAKKQAKKPAAKKAATKK